MSVRARVRGTITSLRLAHRDCVPPRTPACKFHRFFLGSRTVRRKFRADIDARARATKFLGAARSRINTRRAEKPDPQNLACNRDSGIVEEARPAEGERVDFSVCRNALLSGRMHARRNCIRVLFMPLLACSQRRIALHSMNCTPLSVVVTRTLCTPGNNVLAGEVHTRSLGIRRCTAFNNIIFLNIDSFIFHDYESFANIALDNT